jgi:ribokinase
MSSAVVIGSLHMDLIARASRLPEVGQSVSGGTFTMAPGGKAGNQAIALARNGIETWLVARVGDDDFGQQLRSAMSAAGVRTDYITVDSANPTGASTVLASDDGYSSIICPGAATQMSIDDLEALRSTVGSAGMVVLQRELDPVFVNGAIHFCANRGTPVMFNASPPLTDRAEFESTPWQDVSWLIVNDAEAVGLSELAGISTTDTNSPYKRVRSELGVANLVVTMGSKGAVWVGQDQALSIPAFPVKVVDTVGAGDAFLGALAASVIRGEKVETALLRASAAGAIAVGMSGAYEAIPTIGQIDEFLKRHYRES